MSNYLSPDEIEQTIRDGDWWHLHKHEGKDGKWEKTVTAKGDYSGYDQKEIDDLRALLATLPNETVLVVKCSVPMDTVNKSSNTHVSPIKKFLVWKINN